MKKKLPFYTSGTKIIKDTEAATAVEFALVFPLFFFFLMGFIEFGFIMFGNAVIDSVMTRASRRGMVGCIERDCDSANKQTVQNILEEIKRNSMGLVNTTDTNSEGAKLEISIQPVDDIATSLGAEPIWGAMDLGQSGDIVVYAVKYDWSLFLPLPTNIIGFHDEFFTFHFATVVRNEQFAYTEEGDTTGSGEITGRSMTIEEYNATLTTDDDDEDEGEGEEGEGEEGGV